MGTRNGIWAMTLWTAGRTPSLVTFGPDRIGASLLGTLVLERWAQMAQTFVDLAVDEYAILPDRFRAVVHTQGIAHLELALAWFRAAVAQEARLARLSTTGIVWEAGSELVPVESPEELLAWRRRIRTGRALGLSGRIPDHDQFAILERVATSAMPISKVGERAPGAYPDADSPH